LEQLVEIRFTAEDSGTRVELKHSGWENSAMPLRASASATTAAGAPYSSAISSSTPIPLQPA
jgi:hypothetical protein